MERILQTKNHHAWRNNTSFIVEFSKPHHVISSSQLNGGLQTDIQAIFNNKIPFVQDIAELPGGSVPGYLRATAEQLGLNPQTSTGLLTSASMENVAFEKLTYQDLTVEVYVTGGININGGRAGDPASYFEREGTFSPLGGTINILLYIHAALTPEALVKSVITATEAKTAALQELAAPSQYSTGLATGSGTDGVIIASNPGSSLRLTDAGLHSKLGELIGKSVILATKQTLALESGLSAQSQYDVLTRLKRYKIDRSVYKKRFAKVYPGSAADFRYEKALDALSRQAEWISLSTALIHLQDQVEWELIPYEQALALTKKFLSKLLNQSYAEPEQTGYLLHHLVDAMNAAIHRQVS